MEQEIKNKYSKEIDLKEVFFGIIHNIKYVVISILIFISLSIYHISNSEELFTAKSMFILDYKRDGGLTLPSLAARLGGFSAAGIGVETDSAKSALVEKMRARNFTIEVAKELNLYEDKFFNNYSNDPHLSSWKTSVKSLLGWKSREISPGQIMDWNIINSFKNYVSIDDENITYVEVSVKHRDPETAAKIANYIVQKSINSVKNENISDAKNKLQYLTNSLADSLQEYEDSQKRIKEFTLQNSAFSLQNFTATSVILDGLRAKRDQSINQLEAIASLETILRKGSPTQQEYLKLRYKFPLIDQPTFRRILGISESVSSWTWPSPETIAQVKDSIIDRKLSLQTEIKKIEEDATRYAESSEKLAGLYRSLKISEAAHAILVEQVKTQSVLAGYRPDTAKIIEVAEVPMIPSEPNKTIIIGIAGIAGLLVGCAIALFFSQRKGVYYSDRVLLQAINADHAHKTALLRKFQDKSLKQVSSLLDDTRIQWPSHVILETLGNNKNKILVVMDTTSAQNAVLLARIIGVCAGNLEFNSAVLSLSNRKYSSETFASLDHEPHLEIRDHIDGCTEYSFSTGNKNIDWLFLRSVETTLKDLMTRHYNVVLAVEYEVIEMFLSAGVLKTAELIPFVAKGKTPSYLINEMRRHNKLKVILNG